MFKGMRRFKQMLTREESEAILDKCTAGVLGLNGTNGYPYTLPISYVYLNNKIYFHSAKNGYKIECIEANKKVSFTLIDKDIIVEETFTSHFSSVILYGKAYFVEEDGEKNEALEALVKKYSPNYIEDGKKEIEKEWNRVTVVGISVEHMTGKQAIELVNRGI